MGKKKPTQKPTTSKPSTPPRAEQPENPTAAEMPSATQQTPPTAQPEAMISVTALAEILQHSMPSVDWGSTLSALSQGGTVTSLATVIPPISAPPEPILTTESLKSTPPAETPPPTVPSTKETPPTELSQLSPVHPQPEPLNVSPLSAYHDPGSAEKRADEEELQEEKVDGEEKGEVETREEEETKVPESTSARMGDVDLNEAAK